MKEIGKKYPRIYSIHTVGIRNHNNADYLIHPLRTDFTGESSTGKSLVGADLPQLILTAGLFYKSATPTKGGVPREYNTMPLPNFSFAYAFMNIEVAEHEFIIIGMQIKSSRKILIPFIIQGEKYLGYDKNQTFTFKPLKQIIRFKDFLLTENEMPTVEKLQDHLDKKNFFLKSFYHKENEYHKLLFDNNILHLDLSEDTKLQRQFANTLQSLSRGEDIETSGTKFKKFLFHYDNKVEDNFKKESEEIEQSHRNFQSNTEKYFTFTDKKENLKRLLEFKKLKEEAFEARLKCETANSFQKVREQQAKLEDVRKSYFQTELEILAVKEKKIQIEIQTQESELKIKNNDLTKYNNEFSSAKSSFDDYDKEFQSLNDALPTLEMETNQLKSQYEKVQQVENWVKTYSTVPNARAAFETQLEINISRQKLTELNEFLKREKLTKEFEESEYSKSIHDATEFYLERKNKLTEQIEGIKKLISIINLHEPNSFAGWAVNNKKKLNELQEAVLFHFAETPTKELAETKIYIPEPKEFIESLTKAKETEKHFVINLSGVHYYITKRPNYIFNNPDKLQQEINRIGKDYQNKIDTLQAQLDKIENLQKELIQSFKYSEEHLTAYQNRETIQAHKLDETFLKFTPMLFEEAVSIYDADIKKKEEQKVKTLFEKKNSEFIDKLGKKRNSETERNKFLAAKTLAEGKIKTLSEEITEFEAKINSLKSIDLVEIDTKFIAWKSNIENSFKENHERFFQKYKDALKESNASKALDSSLLSLVERSGGLKNEIGGIKQLIPHLQASFDRQDSEYKKHFKEAFNTDGLIQKITDDDLATAKKTESDTERDYKNKYEAIVQHFTTELRDNPVMQKHEYHFNELLYQLIPQQLITNKDKPEDSLLNDIENILADLNQKIQVLNEEETRKIHSTIHSLKEIVEKHLGDLEKIQTHFKEFKLANHHSVSLEFGAADDFDLNWIRKFKDDSQEASFLKSFGFKTNESAHSILERIFKKYCPTVKDPKAHEILDPFNYYDAKAKLIDSTGTQKAATGGTGYGLLALIGIAKLSVVEGKKNIKDIKKGIRILPVDEVAGLGGNFEMLYELAQTLDYQIFTMTISANDLNFQDGKQIYYEFIGSANPEKPYLNEGVHACFSKLNATFHIESYFSDKIFRLPNVITDAV
jgi:exonuclease SbcC